MIYTYNQDGTKTEHKFLFLAKLKAIFQAYVLGIPSIIDRLEEKQFHTIKYYEGVKQCQTT